MQAIVSVLEDGRDYCAIKMCSLLEYLATSAVITRDQITQVGTHLDWEWGGGEGREMEGHSGWEGGEDTLRVGWRGETLSWERRERSGEKDTLGRRGGRDSLELTGERERGRHMTGKESERLRERERHTQFGPGEGGRDTFRLRLRGKEGR